MTEATNMQVPFSAGTTPATLKAPANACDCHHHIFDHRVPSTPPEYVRPDASVADYRVLQKRLGTTRNVVVTASNYAYNNDPTTNAIREMGGNTRGIAVINADISVDELQRLHDAGIRGVRFTNVPKPTWDAIKTIAKKIATFGWHVQFNIHLPEIVAHEEDVKSLPTDVVFDHLGRVGNVADPALQMFLRFIADGKTWIKLSGVYVVDPKGAPTYSNAVAVAKTYAAENPERVIWGSDWPHPSSKIKPDDAVVFDLNREWAPNQELLEQILVRNPERLYDFEKAL